MKEEDEALTLSPSLYNSAKARMNGVEDLFILLGWDKGKVRELGGDMEQNPLMIRYMCHYQGTHVLFMH